MTAGQFDGLRLSKRGHGVFLRRVSPVEDAEIDGSAFAREQQFEAVTFAFGVLPEIERYGFIHRRIGKHLFNERLAFRAEGHQVVAVQAGGAVELVEVRPHLRLVHRQAAAVFDVFLGDLCIFVSGLTEDEVVSIAIPYLAAQIKVAEIGETALGEGVVVRVDVAAGAHAVHETNAGTEHRGAA